jgi:hypothetical protein
MDQYVERLAVGLARLGPAENTGPGDAADVDGAASDLGIAWTAADADAIVLVRSTRFAIEWLYDHMIDCGSNGTADLFFMSLLNRWGWADEAAQRFKSSRAMRRVYGLTGLVELSKQPGRAGPVPAHWLLGDRAQTLFGAATGAPGEPMLPNRARLSHDFGGSTYSTRDVHGPPPAWAEPRPRSRPYVLPFIAVRPFA